jgi:hypothetical protein
MALEGMQPTFRHVPPRAPRFSIQAVFLISPFLTYLLYIVFSANPRLTLKPS